MNMPQEQRASTGGEAGEPAHTPGGAPTDEAHAEAGDGTLQGSVPAGLTPEELLKRADEGQRDNSGTS